MKINQFAAFLFCNLLVCNVLSSQSDWKLKIDKKGIQIYTLDVPDFKFKSFKAVTKVNAPLQDALDVLTNDQDFEKWVYKYLGGEIVKRVSDTEVYFYSATDLPWPFSDRDDVTNVKIIKNPDGSILIDMKDYPDYLPPKKSRVRIPFMKGYWELTPLEDEKTEIVLEILADPGGAIPAWIVNPFITSGPFKTFQNLKEMLGN